MDDAINYNYLQSSTDLGDKKSSQKAYSHGRDPYEIRANLAQLRYQLYKAGIYDSSEGLAVDPETGEEGTNPFTMEHFKQVLNFDENGKYIGIKPEFMNEIMQFIGPEDIVWLMNNIAMDQEIGDDLPEGTMRAKHGGSLPKFQNAGHFVGDGHDHSNDDLLRNVSTIPLSSISEDDINSDGSYTDNAGNTYNTVNGELVLSQTSDAKTWLTEDILSTGYDARWKRELEKNKELGYNLNTEGYTFDDGIGNSPAYHTKDFRLDNLANLTEYLGRPKDYNVENIFDKTRMGNKFFETASGVMLPSTTNIKYPRIYYGSDMSGDMNIPMGKDFSNLRTHEITHGITDAETGMTPYARDLLEKSKTTEDRSNVSFKEWKENINTEEKGSFLSNILSGSSPFTGKLRDNYNKWKNAGSGDYLTNPSEVYSRYKGAQKMMQEKGIFNSFTDTEFTEENYSKLEEYLNSEEFKGLDEYDDIKEFFGTDKIRGDEFNKKMTKDDIMEIMNNVADVNTGMPAGMSKFGGQLPKAKNGSILKCPPFCFGKPKVPKIEIPKIKLTGAYKASYGIKPISLKLNRMLTSPDYQSSLSFIYNNMTTPKVLSETLQGKKTSGVWDVYGLNVNDIKFKELGIEILKHNDSGINNYNTTIKSLINDAVSQIGTKGSYFKSDLLRNSGVGTNIFDEFKTLQDMHSIQPHRVIQPLDLIF